jgi:hypothetical protein
MLFPIGTHGMQCKNEPVEKDGFLLGGLTGGKFESVLCPQYNDCRFMVWRSERIEVSFFLATLLLRVLLWLRLVRLLKRR